jgi:hypothetical protein
MRADGYGGRVSMMACYGSGVYGLNQDSVQRGTGILRHFHTYASHLQNHYEKCGRAIQHYFVPFYRQACGLTIVTATREENRIGIAA